MMRRLLIYVLLIAGSLLFAWPFIWMAGTSVKLEREVLSNRARAFPERPIPRVKSPYLDDRLFSQVTGPHRDEAIAIIEEQIRGHFSPSEINNEAAREQIARGIYERLLGSIPYERWSESADQVRATIAGAITPELIDSVLAELRRSFAIGQLRARSTGLEEDQLVAAKEVKWNVTGPAKLAQQPDFAELRYDFSSGDIITLSRTLTTSFPVERLRRLQLYFRPDTPGTRYG